MKTFKMQEDQEEYVEQDEEPEDDKSISSCENLYANVIGHEDVQNNITLPH